MYLTLNLVKLKYKPEVRIELNIVWKYVYSGWSSLYKLILYRVSWVQFKFKTVFE